MSNNTIQKALIAAASDAKNIPVLEAIKKDPRSASLITKLIPSDVAPKYDRRGNREIDIPYQQALRDSALKVARRSRDVEHIFSMLPDLELVRQVLISSILAPKDLVTTSLNFDAADDIFHSDLRSLIIGRIKDYFESSYKIKDYLYDILDRVLFLDGSYPIAVIPENAIDELINGALGFSNESVRALIHKFPEDGILESKGLLAPANLKTNEVTSLESLYDLSKKYHVTKDSARIIGKLTLKDNRSISIETSTFVTDNYDILKKPKVQDLLLQRRNESILRSSMESDIKSLDSLSDRELDQLLYKRRNKSGNSVKVLKNQSQLQRQSVSEPLIQRFPSESVIPVYVPGTPNHHVGYFVVLDINGSPVTRETLSQFNGAFLLANKSKPFSSSLIDSTSRQLNGSFDCHNPMHQDLMLKTYTDVVTADLSARLRNSNYSSSARIASDQEVYRIMLARELAGNQTQVLWIPIEMMTYFAYEYDRDGVGRSLTEKNSGIAALRSVIQFANVRAGIRNSVGRTVVEITMDENEIDPQRRFEEIVSEFMRQRQAAIPYFMRNPADIVEFVGRAGYEFKVNGPRLPNMTIDKSEVNSNYVKPDSEMAEDLRKQHHMGFGLTSEILDNMNQPEHAVTAVNQSILLTKRVIQYQDAFNPLITDHLRKVILATEKLIKEMNELIYQNYDQVLLTDELRKRSMENNEVKDTIVSILTREFIDSINVSLSRPLTTTINNQMEELENYKKMVEAKVESYLNEGVINDDLLGELSGKVEMLKALLINHFMQLKMSEMGLGDEISEVFNDFGEAKITEAVFNEHKKLISGLATRMAEFLADTKKIRDGAAKVSEALDISGGNDYGSDAGSDYGSSDGESDTGDEEFDDFGGFDVDDTDNDGGDDGSDSGDNESGSDDQSGDSEPGDESQ